MAIQPLRWQHALLITILSGGGVVISSLLAPSSGAHVIVSGASLLAPLFAVVWILSALPLIPLRRERHAWLFIAMSVAMALLANIYRIVFAVLGRELPPLSWHLLLETAGYLLLWFGVLRRSGRAPQGLAARWVLACDVLISLVAVVAIGVHLSFPTLVLSHHTPSALKVMGAGYPFLALITLACVAHMLMCTVPHQQHLPRTMLVAGILVKIGADTLLIYALLTGAHPPLAAAALQPFGYLIYGVALLWDAAVYRHAPSRMRTVDPFPSLTGLFLPMLLVVLAVAYLLHDWTHPRLLTVEGLRATVLSLTILIGLVLLRQVASFANNRDLYRTLGNLYAKMVESASTDPLTGLANHRSFMTRLEREMRRSTRYGRPLALVFADIDHFKLINDTYGHRVGDRALRIIANTLCQGVREIDMVARYGGEEFVVLLPETTLVQAGVLAERLRHAVERSGLPLPHGAVGRMTVSCGVAAYPENSQTMEALLSTADHAMYRAKEKGRNRVVVAASRPQHSLIGAETETVSEVPR